MNLLSLHKGAVHGYRHESGRPYCPVEQGQAARPETPLKLKEIWAIRIRLQLDHRARELALFNLGIDSKLRGCDVVRTRFVATAEFDGRSPAH